MRAIRITAAVIGVFAAMASIGAVMAAAEGGTVLCKKTESQCEPENRYVAPTEIQGKLGEKAVTFTGSLGTVQCTKAQLLGESIEEGESLKGEVASMKFEECTHTGTKVKCTATAVNLPYDFSLTATESGNGTFVLENGGKGVPGTTVVCEKVINCTLSAEPEMAFTAGNPAMLTATKVPVETTGTTCPKEQSYDLPGVLIQIPSGNLAAETGRTVFCTALEPFCGVPKTYGLNTTLESALEASTNAVFKFGAVTIECSAGTLKGKTLSVNAPTLLFEVISMSFSSCLNGCSATVEVAGPSAVIRAIGGGKGEMTIATPKFKMKCASPSFECTYESPNVVLDIVGGVATPLNMRPKIKAENELMGKIGAGSCDTSLLWSGTYVVSTPLPLYVTG